MMRSPDDQGGCDDRRAQEGDEVEGLAIEELLEIAPPGVREPQVQHHHHGKAGSRETPGRDDRGDCRTCTDPPPQG